MIEQGARLLSLEQKRLSRNSMLAAIVLATSADGLNRPASNSEAFSLLKREVIVGG